MQHLPLPGVHVARIAGAPERYGGRLTPTQVCVKIRLGKGRQSVQQCELDLGTGAERRHHGQRPAGGGGGAGRLPGRPPGIAQHRPLVSVVSAGQQPGVAAGLMLVTLRVRLHLRKQVTAEQGWNFDRFLVLLGFRRLYSLSGKYSPSIPFPIEPEIPGTQSTRLRPQFHTESLIGKPKILKRQTHGITAKAYRSV